MLVQALGLIVLGATALVHAQAPTRPIPHGSNVLFGRVLEIGTDAPVAGAVVTLTGYFDESDHSPEGLPQSLATPAASTPRSVMTTNDGSFFFRELPAGRYAISADAFGYLSNTYPMHVIELTNRDAPAEVPLRVWKLGAISGRVIDERGEPVVGVPVTAFRRETLGSGPKLSGDGAKAETDDRGVYRLAQLPPGNYVVGVLSSSTSLPASLAAAIDGSASNRDESWALTSTLIDGGSQVRSGEGQHAGDFVLVRPGPPPVLSPDGKMLTYFTTLYPGTANPADAAVIALASGEARDGIDVPIRFAPTVEVSGVVTGPDGPMNGLTVELQPANGLIVNSVVEPMGLPRAITDARGAFRFLAVSPGSYVLKAAYLVQGPPNSGSDISLWAAQPLTIGDRAIDGLTVAMKQGLHVSGRAEFEGASEAMLAGGLQLIVGLRPIGAQSWRSLPARSASDGTFTTPGDAPGRYVVFASAPSGWTFESVSLGGKPAPDDVIELDTTDLRDLVVTFSRKTTRVAGSIADPNGAADANADVIVFPADTTLWREGIINNRRGRLMHATSAGTFEFSGLATGEYYIAAVSARLVTDWQDPAFLERLISGATKFTLSAGQSPTLSLKTITPRAQ